MGQRQLPDGRTVVDRSGAAAMTGIPIATVNQMSSPARIAAGSGWPHPVDTTTAVNGRSVPWFDAEQVRDYAANHRAHPAGQRRGRPPGHDHPSVGDLDAVEQELAAAGGQRTPDMVTFDLPDGRAVTNRAGATRYLGISQVTAKRHASPAAREAGSGWPEPVAGAGEHHPSGTGNDRRAEWFALADLDTYKREHLPASNAQLANALSARCGVQVSIQTVIRLKRQRADHATDEPLPQSGNSRRGA